MPTASGAHKTGWQPYAAAADPNVRVGVTSNRAPKNRRSFFEMGPNMRAPPKKAIPKPQFSKAITWEEHLELLEQYVARNGDAMVPLEHLEGGVRLGAWLSKQWTEYQADTRGGYLSTNRKLRLEAAGVVFDGPAPPASGAVGLHTLNERKWDTGRNYSMAAAKWHPREWDCSKPKEEGEGWRPYTAEADPGAKKWLDRQRKKGLAAPPEPPPEPYVPLAIVPPVKGLNMALAKKLAKAKEELDRENAGKPPPRKERPYSGPPVLALPY